MVLPPLIFSKKDFEMVEYMITKPNYISTKMITGDIIILKNLQDSIPTLSNKIVIIENDIHEKAIRFNHKIWWSSFSYGN